MNEINNLVSLNIIRASKSPYSSPAFPIIKRNGKIRLVIDYRKLNKITIPDKYIFPKIQDLLSQLNNSKIFSKIDLNLGYYHLPVAENSIKYKAFSINNNKWEFLRIPLGYLTRPPHSKGQWIIYLENLNLSKYT
ncbi:Retrovirus-related Pol polyprotein from transposon gypsy [Dictyocoela muelleri]|nr:Retrovirus-related Pol polyprotein from transposon gypsy [Dictyocoela muelleri]